MKTVTFSDIIGKNGVFIDGDWVESKDQDPDGEVRLLQLADIGDGYFINKSNRFLNIENAKKLKCTFLEAGDVLVARMPDPLGRACIFPGLDKPCVTVVDVCIIRPDKEIVSAEWLKFLINSFDYRNTINKFITGTTRQRISRGNLAKLSFDLPQLQEQISVVGILTLAENLITQRKESITLLDDFLKSTFLKMFIYSNENKDWLFTEVKNTVEKEKNAIKAGPFGSSLKKEFYVEKGYKIYGQEQVIKDDLKFGNYYINEELYKKLESCKIKEGDVLISLVGTYGKISVVPKEYEQGIINPRLMKISFDKNIINPIYFKNLFKSHYLLQQLSKLSRGGTMDIINSGIVKEIKIPVPPIELQNKFASITEKVEVLKSEYGDNLKELKNMYGVLNQKAFKGELKIKQ